MTREEAKHIVGNQRSTFIKNMAVALSLHSWGNTTEEWQRLEAACVYLGQHAPRIARKVLKSHKANQEVTHAAL